MKNLAINSKWKIGTLLSFSVLTISSCVKEDKPNILWITLEDSSPQFFGCYGNEDVKTPNIDKLSSEGVMFNNAFATGPVCSASRSTLITGVNTSQLGTGNHRSRYPIPDYMTGFPSYIRNAGYYTSNNHKTDYNTSNDNKIIKASWDESSAKAGWAKRGEDQHFFSIYNFMDSHQSRTMTNPWNWYMENIFDKLKEDQITKPEEINVPPIYRDTPEMRKYLSRVYNSLNLTDIEVGELLDSLKKDGLMESTIIFLYGDHGEAIPRGKSSSIGLSYRVPFVIWFPEKYKHLSPWKTGDATNELICFEDLPPTILSLAGVEIPSYMTGRAILGEQREEPKPYVFGARNRIDESPNLVRTVTDGQFFYAREFFPRYPSVEYQKYADVSDIVRTIRNDYSKGLLNKNQSLLVERRDMEYLYDLKNDPWELNNLAGDPSKVEKLAEMQSALYNRLISDKDAHFMPEYEIQKIAGEMPVYEYRASEQYKAKEIIDAALEASNPATSPDRLFELLGNKNHDIRYWAAVEIHNYLEKEQLDRERLLLSMEDDFPPVAIETAAILWENFKDEAARKLLISEVADQNAMNSLQALQMVEYMNDIPDDFITAVESILAKTEDDDKKEYPPDYNISSVCEVILNRTTGQPLYIDEYKKWVKPEYLEWRK
jgi:arylsulfatase A-like enzyme